MHCSICCLFALYPAETLPHSHSLDIQKYYLSVYVMALLCQRLVFIHRYIHHFKYQQLIDTLYNTLKFALVPVKFHTHTYEYVCVCDIVYAIRSTLLTTLTLHAVILVADVINTIRILLWFCRVHRYYAVTIMSLYTSNVFFFVHSFVRPLLVCECVWLLSFLQQFYLIIISLVLYACFMNQYTENGHGHYYFYYFGCFFFIHSLTHWLSHSVLLYLVAVIVCCAVIRTLFILFVCLLASMWLLRSCRNAK